MVLDESNFSVSDGNDSTFLDELGGIAFEESVGTSSFVSNYGSDEGGFAVIRLDFFGLDDFDVDVVAVSGVNEATHFDELRFGQLRH